MNSVVYFSLDISLHKKPVQIVAMQFLGSSGHFGLGNTNNLASIDVARAFIVFISNGNRNLYVCAATVCTYAGVFIIVVTTVYTRTVFSFRMRNYKDKSV